MKTDDPEFYQAINPANIIKQTPDFTSMNHRGNRLPLNLVLSAQKRHFLIKKIKKITKKQQRFNFKEIYLEEMNINQKSQIKERYKRKKKKNVIQQMKKEIKSYKPVLDTYQQIMAFDKGDKDKIRLKFSRVFPKTSRFQVFMKQTIGKYNRKYDEYVSIYQQKKKKSWE